MANLKNKILHSLKNPKMVESGLNDLVQAQENLLKNNSNPVFNKNDKNKIMKNYSNLQNIGKSLYRYKKLKDNNCVSEAQAEKDNIENIILKGGISNTIYIWRSENGEHTCDICSELDGQEYDFYDEVHERPHPNCRCYVEISENDTETDNGLNGNDVNRILPQSKSWIMPCNGPIVGGYGEPRSTHVHNGIDIAVPVGTPIKAVADGTVYYAGANDPKGYGQYVIITHKVEGEFVTSEYGHLSSWNVNAGQQIEQGQIIAKSGNTGHSHGPHLHLTIREGIYKGTAVNPNKYINY